MRANPASFETPIQTIKLVNIDFKGSILDIGGGGEGFVSRIAGEQVCLVDIRYSKIMEARLHGIESHLIVGDGCQLCFRDRSFSAVTIWFALGYIPDWKQKKNVIEEASRVLRIGGTLSMYIMHIECDFDSFQFNGMFILPDGSKSKMAYRVRGRQNQNPESIRELLEDNNFVICENLNSKHWSYLVAELNHPKP